MAYVIWTQTAIDQLDEAASYIAKDAPHRAYEFEVDAFAATDRIAQFPLSGHIVPEFANESIRQILFGKYRIIYKCTTNSCHVISFIHGSRDLRQHVDPDDLGFE